MHYEFLDFESEVTWGVFFVFRNYKSYLARVSSKLKVSTLVFDQELT